MSGGKLEGKVALVSGGSRGIGRGIALTLAAQGADVAFCHYRDDEKAKDTVAAIDVSVNGENQMVTLTYTNKEDAEK